LVSTLPNASQEALNEILHRDDPSILAVVLTGSAARGTATASSDVDVYVVHTEEAAAGMGVRRSPHIDETPVTLAELERPGEFGTDEWWSRWSFAWSRVLRDSTDGRVARALHRQATLTEPEQRQMLADRLDGYLNFVYRALRSDRNGRLLERRLDAAESVPWLLDVIFTLVARVRPYNAYLPWELREHPIGVAEWSADHLLPQLEAMLDGDPEALRAAYLVVELQCLAYDAARADALCHRILDGWGADLEILRGSSSPPHGSLHR
jgi:nucleotidyltransferase-like protein